MVISFSTMNTEAWVIAKGNLPSSCSRSFASRSKWKGTETLVRKSSNASESDIKGTYNVDPIIPSLFSSRLSLVVTIVELWGWEPQLRRSLAIELLENLSVGFSGNMFSISSALSTINNQLPWEGSKSHSVTNFWKFADSSIQPRIERAWAIFLYDSCNIAWNPVLIYNTVLLENWVRYV